MTNPLRWTPFWLGASLTQGARVDSNSSLLVESQSFSMLETVSMASGTYRAGLRASSHLEAKNCPWSPEFDAQFSNKRVVGSGATACVYLAENKQKQTVALKVGKGGVGESLSAWNEECKSMQLLRVAACKSSKRGNDGPLLYDLNAMYIPTCTGVGTAQDANGKDVNYYVMHAAGNLELKELSESKYSMDERKSLFAQLVGAVYALHGLDTAHNDLHGGNILLSEKGGKPRLALIDFGELSSPLDPTTPVIPPSTTWLFDYKRDGNAIMAWTSFILNCPAIPEFPVVPSGGDLRDRGEEFKACLKKNGAEEDTIKAMDLIVDRNSRQFPTQGITTLFRSSFVQKHLPKMEKTYTWAKTDGCVKWPVKEIVEFQREVEFSSMYKCETVPTYNKVQYKTRKNGKKVKRTSQQCGFQRSACYSLIPNVGWACDAGTIKGSPCDTVHLSRRSGHAEKTFDGGCLSQNHAEGYKFAKVYPGYVPPKVDKTQRPKRTFKPLTTTTTTTEDDSFYTNMPAKCKCDPNGAGSGKIGCKVHLGRSYGHFCYMKNGKGCPAAKFSKSKDLYYRKCHPRLER